MKRTSTLVRKYGVFVALGLFLGASRLESPWEWIVYGIGFVVLVGTYALRRAQRRWSRSTSLDIARVLLMIPIGAVVLFTSSAVLVYVGMGLVVLSFVVFSALQADAGEPSAPEAVSQPSAEVAASSRPAEPTRPECPPNYHWDEATGGCVPD